MESSNSAWKRVEETVLSAVKMNSDKFVSANKEKLTGEQNMTTAPYRGAASPSPPTDAETKPPSQDTLSTPAAPPTAPSGAPAPPPPPPPQIEKPKGTVLKKQFSELIICTSTTYELKFPLTLHCDFFTNLRPVCKSFSDHLYSISKSDTV